MENGGRQPAIVCRALWQIFGDGSEQTISATLNDALSHSAGDADQAAYELQEKGLIPAVQNVGFEVQSGEIFVIMGLSGSGKSTLVRCLAQLLSGTSGEICIDGEDVRSASKKRLIELRRKKLGMVFQHFGLFPHMTVAENVAYPLRVQGLGRKDRTNRAEEVISLVGLEGREESYPRHLSGGQRQRVGIARSLAVNPDIWFLDEPFSALDPLIRRQLQDEFLNIQATLKKSIVFITHDIAEALKLADHIAIMRDGKIVQIGAPSDIILHPVDNYVREFSKDVAKGQHARLASVMRPTEERPGSESLGANDPGLTTSMTLDTALARCIELYEAVPVRDQHGAVVGVVTPSDLAEALQVESSHSEQSRN